MPGVCHVSASDQGNNWNGPTTTLRHTLRQRRFRNTRTLLAIERVGQSLRILTSVRAFTKIIGDQRSLAAQKAAYLRFEAANPTRCLPMS